MTDPSPRCDSAPQLRAAWLRPKQTDLVPDKGQFRSRFPQSAQRGRDRSGGGFLNAGYEPHPSCGDCPLTASWIAPPAVWRIRRLPLSRERRRLASARDFSMSGQ
jgi:hypothetical protein